MVELWMCDFCGGSSGSGKSVPRYQMKITLGNEIVRNLDLCEDCLKKLGLPGLENYFRQ